MVFRNFLIYSFGALFLKGISLLLIPVYTRVLSPGEYGRLELINTSMSILDAVLTLGLGQVIFVEYYHVAGEARKKMVAAIISIYLAISTPFYLGLAVAAFFGGQRAFPGIAFPILLLALVTAYLTFFQRIFFSVLKISNRALNLTVNQVAIGLGTAILNIYLVYHLKWGLTGIIATNFLMILASSGYAFREFRKRVGAYEFALPREKVSGYLKMGLPFVPGAVASWIMVGMDRWILLMYTDEGTVGIYSIAYRFGSIFYLLLFQPFMGSYSPHIMQRFAGGDFRQHLGWITPLALAVFFVLGLASEQLAKLAVDPVYYPSLPLIPYIVMGYAFWFLAQVSSSIFLFRKKSLLLLYIVMAACCANVALNLLLVPRFQALGAALSSMGSYLAWFAACLLLRWIHWHRFTRITQE